MESKKRCDFGRVLLILYTCTHKLWFVFVHFLTNYVWYTIEFAGRLTKTSLLSLTHSLSFFVSRCQSPISYTIMGTCEAAATIQHKVLLLLHNNRERYAMVCKASELNGSMLNILNSRRTHIQCDVNNHQTNEPILNEQRMFVRQREQKQGDAHAKRD